MKIIMKKKKDLKNLINIEKKNLITFILINSRLICFI